MNDRNRVCEREKEREREREGGSVQGIEARMESKKSRWLRKCGRSLNHTNAKEISKMLRRRLKEKEKDIEVGTIDNWRKSLRKGER